MMMIHYYRLTIIWLHDRTLAPDQRIGPVPDLDEGWRQLCPRLVHGPVQPDHVQSLGIGGGGHLAPGADMEHLTKQCELEDNQ